MIWQFTQGGPIIAVQVENEFGAYSNEVEHLDFLKDVSILLSFAVFCFTFDKARFAGSEYHISAHLITPCCCGAMLYTLIIAMAPVVCHTDQKMECMNPSSIFFFNSSRLLKCTVMHIQCIHYLPLFLSLPLRHAHALILTYSFFLTHTPITKMNSQHTRPNLMHKKTNNHDLTRRPSK